MIRHQNRRACICAVVAALAALALAPVGAADAVPSSAPRLAPSASPTQQGTTHKAAAPKTPSRKAATPKAPTHKTSTHKRPTHKTARPGVRAQDSAAVDLTAQEPAAMRDTVTADFLGRHYDQSARVNGSNLQIYDAAVRGGDPIVTTPTDYSPLSGALRWDSVPISNTAPYVRASQGSCGGCFENVFDVFHLNTIYLASNNEGFYMTGTQGYNVIDPDLGPLDNAYYSYIVSQPKDGSCASSHCTLDFTELPSLANDCNACQPRAVGPTAIAAGEMGPPGNQTGLLAVGYSDGGLEVFTVDTNGQLGEFEFEDQGQWSPPNPEGDQIPVTALAFDPSGSGRLAVGVATWNNLGYFLDIDPNTGIEPGYTTWDQLGGNSLSQYPISAAYGTGATGQPVVAFGMNEGTLRLVDPTTGSQIVTSETGNGGIVRVNPVPRWDGTAGGTDFAVSQQPSDIFSTTGGVLRWDGTARPMTYLPVRTDGSKFFPNSAAYRSWFPGVKQGRVAFHNSSNEPVTVQLTTSSAPDKGCWYAQGWQDAEPFPSSAGGVTVPPGGDTEQYVVGASTAGSGGRCESGSPNVVYRGYLRIAPTSHPADARLVGLSLNKDMTVTINEQSGDTAAQNFNQPGGSTTVSPGPDIGCGTCSGLEPAFGRRTIDVGSPASPTTLSAPSLKGLTLTSTSPAVYRLDVGSSVWTVPGSTAPLDPQVQATIAPLRVQSSADGVSWTDVGLFMPVSGLSMTSPPQLIVKGGSFYLDADPAHPKIRVLAGSLPSATVDLSTLPVPPTDPNLGGISVQLPVSSNATANPHPNGVDQTAMLVTIANPSGGFWPSSNDGYRRVYYTDDDGALITNLYTAGHYDDFIGVQPSAGAYPNGGLAARRGRLSDVPSYDYLSTNSTYQRTFTAHVGTSPSSVSQPGVIQSNPLAPRVYKSAQLQFSIEGCGPSLNQTCSVPDPADGPVLYQAGSDSTGPLIGVLMVGKVQNVLADLPLSWPNGPGQQVRSASIGVSASNLVTVGTPNNYASGNDVTSYLVTHGILQQYLFQVG